MEWFSFDKIKHDHDKLKQDIVKREKRRKGGDGMDGDGDGVLDACMHQARSITRGRERRGKVARVCFCQDQAKIKQS